MTDRSILENLLHDHAEAKRAEAFHRANRQSIEDEIVAITGLKEHGQKTVDAGRLKATVAPNYSYSIDWEVWDAMAARFPVALQPYKVKREPDGARIRALKADHPALYAELAQALTVKPIRPTVEVKPAGE